MSEAQALELWAGALERTRVRRPAHLRRGGKIARLKELAAAQEQELVRRQVSALRLATELNSLRASLESVTAERDSLRDEVDHLHAARSEDSARTARLLEAVSDQHAAVLELEVALAAALARAH